MIKEGDRVGTMYGPGAVRVVVAEMDLCKIVLDQAAWQGTHRSRVYVCKMTEVVLGPTTADGGPPKLSHAENAPVK